MQHHKINITVFSQIDGKAAGHIKVCITPKAKVQNLLELFCLEKKIDFKNSFVLIDKNNKRLKVSKSLTQCGIIEGDEIIFSQEDEEEQLYSFGYWKTIAMITLLISFIGFSFCGYEYFHATIAPKNFGLVIDAGSSHSKLFIFKCVKIDGNQTEDIELLSHCQMSGGVAHFRNHLDDLHGYFTPCLVKAENLVPESSKSKTPLILAATAGMRMLRATDPVGSNLILSAIQEVFMTKTKFLTRPKDVFIASGQQEGINGWAALNYLMKTFQEPVNDDAASALDLGGASVQVTTQITDIGEWPTVNITIFRNTYSVFSKSFMCYGVTEALHRYEYLLVNETLKQNQVEIWNPCLPKGLTAKFTEKDFKDPCVLQGSKKKHSEEPENRIFRKQGRYEIKYGLNSTFRNKRAVDYYDWNSNTISSGESKNKSYILVGTSNMMQCKIRVRQLFNYEKCKKRFLVGDCLNKKLLPPYAGELVGFSKIFLRLLPLLDISTSSSLEEFKYAVLDVCSLSIEQLRLKHRNLTEALLVDLCFDSMYIYSLLTEGLGINSAGWKNILFTDKVEEQDVVWAMGLMLNRTSRFLLHHDISSDRSSFVILFILSVSFLVFAVVFFLHISFLAKSNSKYRRFEDQTTLAA